MDDTRYANGKQEQTTGALEQPAKPAHSFMLQFASTFPVPVASESLLLESSENLERREFFYSQNTEWQFQYENIRVKTSCKLLVQCWHHK